MATVKKVSFGNTGGVGGEAAMEAARRQQMADLLRQQSMDPMKQQMVSGHVVQNSPWEGLTKLGMAWLANRNQKKADSAQSEASAAMAAQQAAALRAMAPPEVFEDQAPQMRTDLPPDTASGFTPLADKMVQPKMSPELRQRWVRALKTYETNPDLGGKLIEDLSKDEEFSTTPNFNAGTGQGYVLGKRGTRKDLEGIYARDKLENINGVAVNMFKQDPGAILPQDPNKPFMQGQGGPVANAPYQQFELDKADRSRPKIDITTKIDNKAAESIASQVGPILKESQIAAQGAQAQIDAANRVISAVDTNKMFAGPLASKRLALTQFADTLGISGRDEQEKISNTRQAIRGLAELTMQGRKLMTGQGAVTEREGELAQRAMSGDIDSMTPSELKQIAAASKRTAEYMFSEHARKVKKASENPATAGIAGYFDVPQITQPQAQQTAPGNQRVRRYNPATGRIE